VGDRRGAGVREQGANVGRFAALGWAAEAIPTGSVETASGDGWTVARIRTSGGRLEAHDLGPELCRVIVGVDGAARVETSGADVEIGPRSLIVVNGDQPLTVSSAQAWARYELLLHSPPSGLVRARVVRPRPFAISGASSRLIGAMAGALIAEPPVEPGKEQVFIGRALSQVVVAAIADSLRLGSTRQLLFERAQHLIEMHYADPAFTVEDLYGGLNTSRSYLYEVFAAYGTSPRRELETRRLEAVRARVALERGRELAITPELLGVSGFSSAKQLRRALRRASEARDEAEPDGAASGGSGPGPAVGRSIGEAGDHDRVDGPALED